MKKLLKLFVIVFVISVLALTFVACEKDCKGDHNLVKYDATVTCTESGDIAYWQCTECDKLFKDANGAEEITQADLAHEALGHDWGDWSSSATCLEPGVETRTCSRCHLMDVSPMEIKILHSFQKSGGGLNTEAAVAAVESSCDKVGNVEYYFCDSCKHYFVVENEKLTDKGTDIAAVQIPVLSHSFIDAEGNFKPDKLVAAQNASCQEVGNVAYYHCDNCKHYFVVENEKLADKGADIAAVQIPKAVHSFQNADGSAKESDIKAAVESTCSEQGNHKYCVCSDCGHYFLEENGKWTDKGTDISVVKTPVAVHSFQNANGSLKEGELKPSKDATCTEIGNDVYYYCEKCKHYFVVENDKLTDKGDKISAVQIPALGHSFIDADGKFIPDKLVAAKNSTCEEVGNIDYYYCENCKHYFVVENEKLTDKGENISAVQTPAKGHEFQNADGSLNREKLVPMRSNSCTEDGNVAYFHCATCGHYYVEDGGKLTDKGADDSKVKIPATGHSFQNADGSLMTDKLVPQKDPNCLEKGNDAYYLCETCNRYFVVENDKLVDKGLDVEAVQQPAKGHDWSDWEQIAESEPQQHTRSCRASGCKVTETKPCTAGAKLEKDASGHWNECTVCHGKMNFVAHNADALNCEVCGWISDKAKAALTVENTSYYTSLQAAYEALGKMQAATASIELLADETADHFGTTSEGESLSAVGNMTLTIDLGGHKLTLNKGISSVSGNVTIKNGVLSSKSDITLKNINATLNLENLQVENTDANGIALEVDGGDTKINGEVTLKSAVALKMIYVPSVGSTQLRVIGAKFDVLGKVVYGYSSASALPDDWHTKLTLVTNGSVNTLTHSELEKLGNDVNTLEYKDYESFLAVLLGDSHEHKVVQGVWVDNGDEEFHFGICECETVLTEVSAKHNWKLKSSTAATCAAEGKEVYECADCKATKEVTLEKTDKHDWKDWTVEKAADCTNAGIETRVCNLCGENDSQTVPALGHDYIVNVCKRCDKTLLEEQVMIMLFGDGADNKPLAKGESLKGTFKLTGVITGEIINVDATHVTLNICVGGDSDHLVQCLELTYAAAQAGDLAVGNTIEVTGELKNVDGTVLFANATFTRIWTDADKVKADLDAITLAEKYCEDFVLPQKGGVYASAISWAIEGGSSEVLRIGEDGKATVTPKAGEHVKVTLVATVKLNEANDTRAFNIIVKETLVEHVVTFDESDNATLTAAYGANIQVQSGDKVDNNANLVVTLAYDENEYKFVSFTVNGAKSTPAKDTDKEFHIVITAETTFSVEIVPRYISKTISELYAEASLVEQNIRTSGIVTGIDGSNVYVQEASGKAILGYDFSADDIKTIAVGDKITFNGQLVLLNERLEIVNATLYKREDGEKLTAKELVAEDIAKLTAADNAQLVSLKGLEFVQRNELYEFKFEGSEVTVQIQAGGSVASLFRKMSSGDKVDLDNVFLGWNGALQIEVFTDTQVGVKFDLTAEISYGKVAPGKTVTVTPSTSPAFVLSYYGATFASDNPDVATVEDGVVTGVAVGQAVISVTVNGKMVTVPVVVDNLSNKKINFTFDSEIVTVNYNDASVTMIEEIQGTTVVFTLSVKEGYIASALANGKTFEPDLLGNYKVLLEEDVAISIDAYRISWELVTDISQLNDGDKILIAAADTTKDIFVMSNDGDSNKKATTATAAGNIIRAWDATTQVMTLVKTDVTGKFMLRVGEMYLNAPKSTSNTLKVGKLDPDTLPSYQFAISYEKGNCVITVQAGDEQKALQYNATSGLFSCYAKANQDPVAIYKMHVCIEHSPETEWDVNETKHWQICRYCGDVLPSSAHSFLTDEGKLKTEIAPEDKIAEVAPGKGQPGHTVYYKCSDCGRFFTVSGETLNKYETEKAVQAATAIHTSAHKMAEKAVYQDDGTHRTDCTEANCGYYEIETCDGGYCEKCGNSDGSTTATVSFVAFESDVALTDRVVIKIDGQEVQGSQTVNLGLPVSFTLEVKKGFVLLSVKVGEEVLTPDAEGKYTSPIVKKDMTVTISTEEKTGWHLVNNAADLKAGDVIAILGKKGTDYYALSTNQKSTNRGALKVTVENNQISDPEAINGTFFMQFITLEATADGTAFKLCVGENAYLYAAGGTASNHLKTASHPTENTAAFEWIISVDEKGVASIKSKIMSDNTSARGELLFNSNDMLFSAYKASSNTITAPVIFKLYECATHTASEVVATPPTCSAIGNVQYWACSVCGSRFSDKDCTTPIDSIVADIVADAHSFWNVAAGALKTDMATEDCIAGVPAGVNEVGHTVYYHCSYCDKHFTVSGATLNKFETKEAVLAVTQIHKDTHELQYKSNNDGTHSISCKNCNYSESASETCEVGTCSKCGYKDESVQLVDITIQYTVGGADAGTPDVTIEWYELNEQNEKTPTSVGGQVVVGKTYFFKVVSDSYGVHGLISGATPTEDGFYTLTVGEDPITVAIDLVQYSVQTITATADSDGYNTETKNAEFGEIKVSYNHTSFRVLADGTNYIQINGRTSQLWSRAPVGKIEKIEVAWSAQQSTARENALEVEFSQTSDFTNAQKFSGYDAVKETTSVIISPSGIYGYFRLTCSVGYACYIESITIYYSNCNGTPSAELQSNDTHHWQVCSVCGRTLVSTFAEHSISAWTRVDGTVTHSGSCTDCGKTVTANCADGDKNGKCDSCDAAVVVLNDVTINLKTNHLAKPEGGDGNSKTVTRDGITVTNEKGTGNPIAVQESGSDRFYKGSNLIIEYTSAMSKIKIVCDSSYSSGLDGLEIEGATITRDGGTIVIELNPAATSLTITGLTNQIRVQTITVYYA